MSVYSWHTLLKITTFEALYDLIILEQYKDTLPPCVATYVGDHKDVKMALEVAQVLPAAESLKARTYLNIWRVNCFLAFYNKGLCVIIWDE